MVAGGTRKIALSHEVMRRDSDWPRFKSVENLRFIRRGRLNTDGEERERERERERDGNFDKITTVLAVVRQG